MMIWFAGVLQNTSCNKTNEIKQTKKTVSCECGAFYTNTRVDYEAVSYKY